MTLTYAHPFPAALIDHVTAMCGREGEEWLSDLPGMIGELESLWSIEVLEPFAAGEFNFVAPASRGQELCVVKISPPFSTIEIFGEAAYLRSRNGNGAVRLLADDEARRAILIEHALPGKNLTELFGHDKPASVEPAIGVLSSIIVPPPEDLNGITTLDHWFDGMKRYVTTGFRHEYAKKAFRFYDELSGQPDRTFYLHGDFHPGNVVSATRAPFLAIDPKGVIGHLGYDIAVFLNNLQWWLEAEPDVRDRLGWAVKQFSNAFQIDPVELRQWAFAQMVLGGWWSFDEMPQYYDNAVAKADIWDV